MKIRTVTHIALAAAVTAVLAFVVMATTFYRTLQDSTFDRQILYSLTQGVAEMQIRTGEYLDPGRFDLRPLRQWRLRDEAIRQALAGMRGKSEMSQKLVGSLSARQEEIRNSFDRLVQLHTQYEDDALTRAQEQRLVGRLFVLFEEQLSEADELRLATLASDTVAMNRVMGIGAVILVLLLGAVVYAVATVRRSMSAPMQRLLAATEAIGEGRLEHRIGLDFPNEIGELAHAIDNMAKRLQSVTSSRDELKRADEALRRLNETLEERVAERTRELENTHAQLRQSQKMEAVGQLTGGIAHDFNNLLAGIVGNLEMMRVRLAQGRTSDLPRYVDSVMAVVDRAASLTHRLLAFSRRQTLAPRPTAIGQLIDSMKDLIGRTVGPSVRLNVHYDENLWMTLCDAHQLENTLLNLAINARDAMPDGGRLLIDAANVIVDDSLQQGQPDLAPGLYVAITVVDTGSGMTPEVLARAFDPFFTTKPIGHGTGLGLSMIYGFVRQSGGDIRIDSEPGAGTRIWLYLPRYAGSVPDAPVDSNASDMPRADSQKTIILIVDDEPEVRLSTSEMLDELGYTVVQAAGSEEAMMHLQSMTHIDLLITDIGLPGDLNGSQLADAAREIWPDLKVLFITGYAQEALNCSDETRRDTEVLSKPFGLNMFASKVRTMLEPIAASAPVNEDTDDANASDEQLAERPRVTIEDGQ